MRVVESSTLCKEPEQGEGGTRTAWPTGLLPSSKEQRAHPHTRHKAARLTIRRANNADPKNGPQEAQQPQTLGYGCDRGADKPLRLSMAPPSILQSPDAAVSLHLLPAGARTQRVQKKAVGSVVTKETDYGCNNRPGGSHTRHTLFQKLLEPAFGWARCRC